jgi:hypothetical protein
VLTLFAGLFLSESQGGQYWMVVVMIILAVNVPLQFWLMNRSGGPAAVFAGPPPFELTSREGTLCKYKNTDSAYDGQDCPICLSAFDPEESVIVLNCEHVYHAACMAMWASSSATCPKCRSPIHDDVKPSKELGTTYIV